MSREDTIFTLTRAIIKMQGTDPQAVDIYNRLEVEATQAFGESVVDAAHVVADAYLSIEE